MLAAAASLLTRRPALTVSLAYALLWEGGQFLLAGADFADTVLGWVAVTLGCLGGHRDMARARPARGGAASFGRGDFVDRGDEKTVSCQEGGAEVISDMGS